MTPYEKARKKAEEAENEMVAELFLECCIGDPHVQDKNGKWLTREEVYQKLLRGDKE